jgi:hypothetical protein
MALTSSDFSILFLNLFIGLSKNSRILSEYSKKFSQDLGYNLHAIEHSFAIKAGRNIKPELVLTSAKLKNTLLLEWTLQKDAGGKRDQLNRYKAVTIKDLSDSTLAVPSEIAQNVDFSIFVNDTNHAAFKKYFEDNKIDFPLSVLELKDSGACELYKIANTYNEQNTEKFFESRLSFERIPKGYAKFSFDTNLAEKDIAKHVAINLQSFIVKEEKTFTNEVFCREMVGSVWNFIGQENKKLILQRTKEILTDFISEGRGSRYLKRIGQSPPEWEILVGPDGRLSRKEIEAFIAKHEGKPYQPPLQFSEE